MLRPEDYFDLAGSGLEDLFAGVEYVWEALTRLEEWLVRLGPGRIEGEVSPGAWVGPGVSIGPGTIVEPGAFITGPTVIGAGCQIRHGAYVRGHCWIGPGCVVGHATELKRVVMFPGAAAPHLAYVGDSILGRRVNLGAGVKTANLKNDRSEVVVVMGPERISTGLVKFGAVIGDRTQLGCNCVTTPGTLIGPDSLVYPNVMLRGVYPRGRIVKGRGPVEVAERVLVESG